jgi:hypothetical protein
MTALRALLAEVVDYAGLFPPASLDMPAAVRSYATYRADPEAWILGRFVLPVSRLSEFESSRRAVAPVRDDSWRLSALFGVDVERDLARAHEFNARSTGRALIDSMEGKLSAVESIESLGRLVWPGLACFVEIPVDREPGALVAAIHRAGLNAKIRTGGVTPADIPSPTVVVRFIQECARAGVAFKATAGLHHPIRAEYPLTYEPDAPRGVMYGYLNVFLASALVASGADVDEAVRALEERDPGALKFEADAIAWRGYRITTERAMDVRRRFARSFGSCSFREPVDELRTITGAGHG